MRRKVGRIRELLAERLRKDFGYQIEAEDLWVQNPVFWRWGLCRWGADCRNKDGKRIQIASWNTMKESVQTKSLGIVDDDGFLIELSVE